MIRRKRPVVWRPQAGPQEALLSCPIPDVFFGGARGGGKTDGLLGDFAAHAGRYGSAARGILFRRTYPELEEIERRSRELYAPVRASYNAGSRTWTFPNVATLRLRHLDRDEHADEYQGHQYTWMGFDELQSWPQPAPVDRLWATLRSPHGVPCVRRSTGNPGGPGHQWVRRRYIDPVPPMTPFKYRPQPNLALEIEAVFIPARLEDNLALVKHDPQYESRLAAVGNPELYKAWRFGNWDVVAGAALDLNPDVHIVPNFEPPAHWAWFGSFDWGYAHPWCFVACVTDERGVVYVVDTLTGRRMHDREIAERIGHHFDVSKFSMIAAGHDCFAQYRARGDTAPSTEEEFARHRIYLSPANIRRIPGLVALRRYLAYGPEQNPSLVFMNTPGNRRCVAQLQAIVLDPNDPEDVLKVDANAETGEGGDDCYDALRYAMCSRPSPAPDVSQGEPFNIWNRETLEAEHERNYRRRADARDPTTFAFEELERGDYW